MQDSNAACRRNSTAGRFLDAAQCSRSPAALFSFQLYPSFQNSHHFPGHCSLLYQVSRPSGYAI